MHFNEWKEQEILEEKRTLFNFYGSLNEGGNTRAINRETGETIADAEKIDLKKFKRKKIQKEFIDAFKVLDAKYKKAYSINLWPEFEHVISGYAFNGSADAFFKDTISDEDFVKAKPKMGDIDVVVPHENLIPLFNLLGTLEGTQLTPNVSYIGQQKKNLGGGHQINGVFKYLEGKYEGFFQIDFEGSEFTSKGKPSTWAKFSHSSSWNDMQKGFKGVNHKFLLINLTRGLSSKPNVLIAMPSSVAKKDRKTKEVKRISYFASSDIRPKTRKLKDGDIPRYLAFSVDRGLRIKIRQMNYVDTNDPIIINGKFIYEEIPTSESAYETDITKIFSLLFHKEPKKGDEKKMWSFLGVLELMKKYNSKKEIKTTFDYLITNSLFGKAAQQLERNNPELDFKIKWGMVKVFIEEFPFLKSKEANILKMADEYAKNYKMR